MAQSLQWMMQQLFDIHTHTRTRAHTHTRTHARTHTRTHTHTQLPPGDGHEHPPAQFMLLAGGAKATRHV